MDHNARSVTPAVLAWATLAVVVGLALAAAAHDRPGLRAAWLLALSPAVSVAAVGYAVHVRRSPGDAAWHGGMVAGIGAFLSTAAAALVADQRPRAVLTVTAGAILAGALAAVVAFAAVTRRSGRRS
ncbi:MAG: hypothetical protein D6701_15395 [Gemmatimonadetes bacterium]|nr:MAG: hypothetical protein D6701_15395 [Gemmatimonadota bacterium]